jgi:signal transduction histidine kinase
MSDPRNLATLPGDAIVAALPVGIAVIDAADRLVLANPAFQGALGSAGAGLPAETPAADIIAAASGRGLMPRQVPLSDGGFLLVLDEDARPASALAPAASPPPDVAPVGVTVQIGIAAFAPGGRLIFHNPRLAVLLGVAPEAITIGMPFEALLGQIAASGEFSTAEGSDFIAKLRAAAGSELSAGRVVLSSGQVLEVTISPLPDGGWTITVLDISTQAAATDEARQRAGLLDSILAAVPHGICVYDADRRVILYNPTYLAVMAGAPLQIGDHITDVIRRRAEAGEFGPGEAAAVYAEQMAFDVSRPQRRRRRRPDGTAIDIRTVPMPGGGHISVVSDITPLVAAEAEITRRAEEMSTMLASIRHGIMLWDADRRLVASNDVVGRLFGHPPELLMPGTSEADLIKAMLHRGEWGTGETAEAEARLLRERDHSVPYTRQITTSGGKVLDARSEPTPGGGWITTFTDVTEEHNSAEELRRAKEVAEAANQAKSRFLATMSHELRTPLNAVIGFSDALSREAHQPGSPQVAEFAQQINDAGKQLLGFINIILDVTRIESGRFDLASDSVDVARLLRGVARQAEASASAAEIKLIASFPNGLPMIRCDERRLQQALTQILSNAIKFTDAGGEVSVGARVEPGGDLEIWVRDTGIGIAEQDLERAFEPFTQLDSTLARRYQGAGLGLYIARALISGHGGTLRLSSVPGEGTVAQIRLPAERLLSSRPARKSSSQARGRDRPERKPRHGRALGD